MTGYSTELRFFSLVKKQIFSRILPVVGRNNALPKHVKKKGKERSELVLNDIKMAEEGKKRKADKHPRKASFA